MRRHKRLVAQSVRPTTRQKYERDWAQICAELARYNLGRDERLSVSTWCTYLTLKVAVDEVSAARLSDLAAAVTHHYMRHRFAGNPVEARQAKRLLRMLKQRQRLVKPRRPSRVLTRRTWRVCSWTFGTSRAP